LRLVAKVSDRRGAQLSQECPHLSTTSELEQTAARHNVIGCGRLFRLGLAVQVVSALFNSFRMQDLILPEFLVPRFSAAGCERDSPGFRFDFRTAEAKDFSCILHRLALFVVEIHGQKV